METDRHNPEDKLPVKSEAGNSCPVTHRERPITGLKKILVPTDFSDCSRQALRYAIAFAEQFDGEIVLLAVIPGDLDSIEKAAEQTDVFAKQRRERFQMDLLKLADEKLRHLRHQILVKDGKPFEEIVQVAKDLDLDLIVISTHGYPGVTRVEIGSTAERVIRHASCPVLVVRPMEREFVPPA